MSVIDLASRQPLSTVGNAAFEPESYNLEVVNVQPYAEPQRFDEGSVWFDEWTVRDHTTGVDSRYREVTGIPSSPISDISVGIGTPWLTSEKGHNFRTLLRYMSVGIPGRLIGPPRIWVQGKNLKSSIEATVEASAHVELGKDALAFLMIMAAQDETGSNKRSLAPGESHFHGESRPGMFGFGAVALADEMGWTLHVPELIDPCLADKTTLRDFARPQHIKRGVGEALTLLTGGAKLLLERRRLYYGDTLDHELEYLIPAVATWKALSNGQTGTMAEHTGEAPINVTFFNQSIANDEVSFQDKLKNNPNVKYFKGKGGHVAGILCRESLFGPIGRVVTANKQLEAHGYIVDLAAVHEALPIAS